jgi:elongation factor Ts
MMDCKKALGEVGGNMEQAVEYLRKKGIAKAEKRAGREVSEGLVWSYIHHNHKVGVLVEVNCETDFVARGDVFRELCKELSLHIASAAPVSIDKEGVPADLVERERRIYDEQTRASGKPEAMIGKIVDGKVEAFYKERVLLAQPWIRDPKKSIDDLIKETSAKVGENIVVRRFTRYQLGAE